MHRLTQGRWSGLHFGCGQAFCGVALYVGSYTCVFSYCVFLFHGPGGPGEEYSTYVLAKLTAIFWGKEKRTIIKYNKKTTKYHGTSWVRDIIKQCAFVRVGLENITMGCSSLVQGDSNRVWICTRWGHPMVVVTGPTWTDAHCSIVLCFLFFTKLMELSMIRLFNCCQDDKTTPWLTWVLSILKCLVVYMTMWQ